MYNILNMILYYFRFSDNEIVRNSLIDGEWSSEEKEGGLPLKLGQEFSILIKCEEDGYRIDINNNFFTFYNNRLPMQSVHKLEVTGKIKLFKIMYQCNEVSSYLINKRYKLLMCVCIFLRL